MRRLAWRDESSLACCNLRRDTALVSDLLTRLHSTRLQLTVLSLCSRSASSVTSEDVVFVLWHQLQIIPRSQYWKVSNSVHGGQVCIWSTNEQCVFWHKRHAADISALGGAITVVQHLHVFLTTVVDSFDLFGSNLLPGKLRIVVH